MQINFPVKIEYGTAARVPISDVIDSLTAVRQILEDGSASLGSIVPDLDVQKVQISVRQISQESPLREIFLVTLFITFQKDLEAEVPRAIETFTGVHVSDDYRTMVVLASLMTVYYGLSFAKDAVSKMVTDTILRSALDEVIEELSKITTIDAGQIRKILRKKYVGKRRLKSLAIAAIKFLRPSKEQSNAPIEFDDRRIEPRLIEESPRQFELEEALSRERYRSHSDVPLEIHAQDKDRETAGWAAVPKGIEKRRLKMKLVDGVSPEQLWNKDEVKADVVIKYRQSGETFEPYEIHLTRIKDD